MQLGIEVGSDAIAMAALDGSGSLVASVSVRDMSIDGALNRGFASLNPEILESVSCVVIVIHDEIQAGQLQQTAVLRLSGPAHPALGPLAVWPSELSARIGHLVETISGGATLAGTSISEPDWKRVADFARRAAEAGVLGFAVCAAGSPTRPDLEESCAEAIASAAQGLSITLSHTLGGSGLRDRENAAVLNAALRPWAAGFSEAIERTLNTHGIDAPAYVARTSGGAVVLEYFRQNPIVCIDGASGCLFAGAAHLAKLSDAVVVDAGRDGIRSVILESGEMPTRPESFYDSAVRMSVAEVAYEQLAWEDLNLGVAPPHRVGQPARPDPGNRQLNLAAALTIGGFNSPMIVVGPRAMDLAPELVPENAEFAAAVGAARSPVRAELERVIRVDELRTLAQAVEQATEDALNLALEAGADRATIRIERLAHAPMSYLPPGFHRIVVRSAGEPKSAVSA